MHRSPEVAPKAKRDIEELGLLLGRLLLIWLGRLARGQVDARDVSVLAASSEPPWQRGDFAPGAIVIFRRLSQAERRARGGDSAPQLLVARVVTSERVDAAIAELLREAEE